jgi:hypothetical protein
MEGLGPTAGDVVDAVVEVLLRGVHVHSIDDVLAVHAGVRLRGLRDVATGGSVDRALLHPSREDRFSADTLEAQVVDASLTLVATRASSLSDFGAEERSNVSVSAGWAFSEARSLREIEDRYVGALQDLVTFATRQRSFVQSLALTIDQDRRWTVEVLRAAAPQRHQEERVYALSLNLAEVDDPAALITRWYELREKVGPVWRVFFSVLDRPESLLEDRLLGLLSFAEGYHRSLHDRPPLSKKQQQAAEKAIKAALDDRDVRAVYRSALSHANQETQGARLAFLAGRAADVLEGWWYMEPEIFARRLVHTRNWLVHWGDKLKHAAEEPAEMAELLRASVLVLYVNLLLDLGLPTEAVVQAVGGGWRLEGPPDDIYDFVE